MISRQWLVTGAAGFIGFHVTRHLLERGDGVVGLDNYFSGSRENAMRLGKLGGNRFRMIEGDIRNRDDVNRAITDCDVVVNLAGQVSVQRSLDDPLETHAINDLGFIHIHQASVAAGVSRLVYASSCAVYGNSPALPLDEDELPHPLSPYAASKLANENYAAGVALTAGTMKAVGLRFFNVFGAWQPVAGGYAAVVPKWMEALLSGRRPVLFGDGSATRDFVFVKNICDAVTLAGTAELLDAYPVFNIGAGVQTRLDELFDTIAGLLRSAGRDLPFDNPENRPWRAGDVMHSVSDISRATAKLGYRPAVDLRNGLVAMLAEQYNVSVKLASQGENTP